MLKYKKSIIAVSLVVVVWFSLYFYLELDEFDLSEFVLIDKTGYRRSLNIQEAKKAKVFIAEYKFEPKQIKLANKKIIFKECWIEYESRAGRYTSKPSKIIYSNHKLFIEFENPNRYDVNCRLLGTIAVRSNNNTNFEFRILVDGKPNVKLNLDTIQTQFYLPEDSANTATNVKLIRQK
jgi:hypothetical protein